MTIPNWQGFVENEKMKQVAIETLRNYGVGTCGPSGFYGTIGGLACPTTLASRFGPRLMNRSRRAHETRGRHRLVPRH
jgi:hypothetical protein